MKRIILLVFSFFIFFSFNIFADEDLTGKNVLCSDLLWGFEFISSEKVNVISTDTNNITKVKEYYYKNDFELSYVNLYLSAKNLKDAVFSIHHQTLRVDIWTMTSGGNTTREFIPAGFCKDVKIDNMLDYIEGSK